MIMKFSGKNENKFQEEKCCDLYDTYDIFSMRFFFLSIIIFLAVCQCTNVYV